jgi:DNA-binding LacI/PurR family transcriptional regulator
MAEGNWKGIAAEIAAKIESGEFAPGSRLPSGDQLARELGVNRNATHRAVEELQRQGLVVRRQGSGTVVAERAEKKGCRIALLVDGYSAAHNFPSGDLLRGIQDRIGEESSLVIADSKHDTAQENRQLRRLARETDGILFYATSLDRPTPALQTLLEEGFPVVAIDRMPQGVELDGVFTDNCSVVRKVIHSLVERGHTRIGFLGFHRPSYSSVLERFEGYREEMVRSGLPYADLVRWLPDDSGGASEMSRQLVQDAILALRHGPDPITALFCVEDGVGCAAVPACERLGIHLPDDLELSTFIDWHPMTLRTPWNVRRIVQRKYDLGHAAAGLLLDRIASPRRPVETVRVDADIIPADSDLNKVSASPSAFRLETKEGHQS